MEVRALKRLEALLRRADDKASAKNEREIAVGEALRIVVRLRQGLVPEGAEWQVTTPMRYTTCQRCGEEIRPLQRAYHNDCFYLHLSCMENAHE